MTDISLKFKADQLGKDLENLSESIQSELNQAVKDLSHAAYANIVANAQSKLNSTRAEYLKGLNYTDLGDNSYLITLEGKAALSTEEGYGSFDMKPGLLGSKKKTASGDPWVKTNADGKKYARVPFQHRPTSKAGSDLSSDISKMTAYNPQGELQKLTKIFKDDFGKPLTGKVATVKSDIPNLNNLAKYQYVSKSGAVSSLYMTFRTVTEDSPGFIHPGYEGLHSFPEAEKYVEEQLELIIKTLL